MIFIFPNWLANRLLLDELCGNLFYRGYHSTSHFVESGVATETYNLTLKTLDDTDKNKDWFYTRFLIRLEKRNIIELPKERKLKIGVE